ncbi:uncharacterized protein LOC126866907 [Bombus huntii]|uniref:uncharacterized protein LOC126866907 n=1 Tax=Bombus huntii TaxID=85661 RepID=UPI0021A9D4CE|nr:uncharacterized protein LOC126866907 [Bombus huntii]
MQAAEMMRGTRTVYNLVFLISLSIAYVHSYPLQVLPVIPGYIPVYIRHGDQPLEEINPALAEAFHEGPSLSKKTDLDNTSDFPAIILEEGEINKYNVHPVKIRQMSSPFNPKDEKNSKLTEGDVKRHREKHVKKIIASKPVVKVNPLTEEEKADLENLRTDIGEGITNLDNIHDSNLHLLTSTLDKSNQETNERISSGTKLNDRIITDDSSSISKDLAQHLTEESHPTTQLTINDKPPVKEQPFSNVSSNVQKTTHSSKTLPTPEEGRTENRSRKFEVKMII